MKYRAKIYIEQDYTQLHITTRSASCKSTAEIMLNEVLNEACIEQATGGHIEKYVDGIGWVVCEED